MNEVVIVMDTVAANAANNLYISGILINHMAIKHFTFESNMIINYVQFIKRCYTYFVYSMSVHLLISEHNRRCRIVVGCSYVFNLYDNNNCDACYIDYLYLTDWLMKKKTSTKSIIIISI